MAFTTTQLHNHPHPYTFEKAREAIITINSLRLTLSDSERETLALLLDTDAMTTIEQSLEEAAAKNFEPLETAVQT